MTKLTGFYEACVARIQRDILLGIVSSQIKSHCNEGQRRKLTVCLTALDIYRLKRFRDYKIAVVECIRVLLLDNTPPRQVQRFVIPISSIPEEIQNITQSTRISLIH